MGVTEANVSEFALGLCFAAVDGSLKPEKLVVALLAKMIQGIIPVAVNCMSAMSRAWD